MAGLPWLARLPAPWLPRVIVGRTEHCPRPSAGRGQLDGRTLSLLHSVLCTFSITDFNRHAFAVIDWKHEYNSFAEFCEYFQKIIEPLCPPNIHCCLSELLCTWESISVNSNDIWKNQVRHLKKKKVYWCLSNTVQKKCLKQSVHKTIIRDEVKSEYSSSLIPSRSKSYNNP